MGMGLMEGGQGQEEAARAAGQRVIHGAQLDKSKHRKPKLRKHATHTHTSMRPVWEQS